jgi:hypothetical protein
MLKEFIADLESKVDKETKLLQKAYDIRDARVKENKELIAELDTIGTVHPGFSNVDPSI